MTKKPKSYDFKEIVLTITVAKNVPVIADNLLGKIIGYRSLVFNFFDDTSLFQSKRKVISTEQFRRR